MGYFFEGGGTVLTAMALTVAAVALLLAASGGGRGEFVTPATGCFVCRVHAAEYTPVFHKAYSLFFRIFTKKCEGFECATSCKSMSYSTIPPPSNI
jgi:hypothetical protein